MAIQFSDRVNNIKTSDTGAIMKLTAQPDIISFAGGLPAEELFPLEEVKASVVKMLDAEGQKALQYGVTNGYAPLREQIAQRMNSKLKTDVKADEILVTNGSQQGLDLVARLFCNKGDVIVVEKPTYLGAISAFNLSEVEYVEISTDENGMILEELEEVLKNNKRVRMIYVIPDFQNPMGITWSLERRKRFMEIANTFEIPVIEDNPYGELRFDGEFLPSLKSLDTKGLVLLLGTFSKTFAPGFRLGWIAANKDILDKCELIKAGLDLATASSAQRVASYWINSFSLDAHVAKVSEVYAKRCKAMLDAMDKYFPKEVTYTRPQGGLFCWVTLPKHVNAREVLLDCIDKKVAFVPGGAFFVSEGNENYMRLNYSCSDEEKIEVGIKRIAEVLETYVK